METAIELRNVSKKYTVWFDRPDNLKKILVNLVKFKWSFAHKEQVEVLNNVSFKIAKGEFVGIMGRNGVGKSTILKLLSGIYYPNGGQVLTHGRIASLLELGAGFEPELSGFENIYLNASILGYGRAEIASKIDQIIEFSGLGEKINQPVKTYSSGMLIRLGFSVATHLEAEILLFDEILSVGDFAFQKKCLDKIAQLVSLNKTIILVTHIPEQVEAFCSRCIVVDKKTVAFDGPTHDGAAVYRKLFEAV